MAAGRVPQNPRVVSIDRVGLLGRYYDFKIRYG